MLLALNLETYVRVSLSNFTCSRVKKVYRVRNRKKQSNYEWSGVKSVVAMRHVTIATILEAILNYKITHSDR